jgi:hypothetical protein
MNMPQEAFLDATVDRHGATKASRVKPTVVGVMAAHVNLEWVRRIFALLKHWALGVYHGLRRRHIQRYLEDSTFRFKRRRSRPATFHLLLGIAGRTPPLTYRGIVHSGPDTTKIAPHVAQNLRVGSYPEVLAIAASLQLRAYASGTAPCRLGREARAGNAASDGQPDPPGQVVQAATGEQMLQHVLHSSGALRPSANRQIFSPSPYPALRKVDQRRQSPIDAQ